MCIPCHSPGRKKPRILLDIVWFLFVLLFTGCGVVRWCPFIWMLTHHCPLFRRNCVLINAIVALYILPCPILQLYGMFSWKLLSCVNEVWRKWKVDMYLLGCNGNRKYLLYYETAKLARWEILSGGDSICLVIRNPKEGSQTKNFWSIIYNHIYTQRPQIFCSKFRKI